MKFIGIISGFRVFQLCLLHLLAAAGPDTNPLLECVKFTNGLSSYKRAELREAVQDVQTLWSSVELARLNATTDQSRLRELESYLESNKSRLVGADLAWSCLAHRRLSSAYPGRPTFSILLEYFKRPWAIRNMATSLRNSCDGAKVQCELVVNVDNPHEAETWTAIASEMAGFLVPVFSFNVHESRGYNRAARLARGRFLIIWQDDQFPPTDTAWLRRLMRIFHAWPQLAIVGMNTYRLCRNHEPTNRHGWLAWDADPRTGVKWSFVHLVDFAPMAIRAEAFHALGGLEEGFTRRGECGIWGDWELSMRAWVGGWQVGYLFLDGRSGDGHEGGTHTSASAERCWGLQQLVSGGTFGERYGSRTFELEVCEKTWELNMRAFTLSDHSGCPYGNEDTTFGNCTQPGSRDVSRQEGQWTRQ